MEVNARLLGPPHIRLGSSSFAPPPTKATALLYYLAYKGDWCSRDELLYLLYPDVPESAARNNLRQRLMAVRHLPYTQALETEAARLRWTLDTDVQAFQQAAQEGRHPKAIGLYQGRLLEGFTLPGTPEFESWLEAEREVLHNQWRNLVFKQASTLEGKAAEQAPGLLQTVLKHDPLDEEALQLYMRLAAHAGQRTAALKAYWRFSSSLTESLAMAPTSATQELAAVIERDDFSPQRAVSIEEEAGGQVAPSWPHTMTSFVGRQQELERLSQLLGQDDCRLLTILGPGGIGKTRLALQALQVLGAQFLDGCYFAPLEALSNPGALPSVVATALGLELSGHTDPLGQVVRAIGTKRVLLVLDNYEHLLDAAPLASKLIEGCPNLKLLATSRERLDLAEEWLLPLEGLSLPDDGPASKSMRITDAVTLFIQRAQQVRPAFAPAEEDLRSIMAVCRLVEGSPLAIELSAVWVRVMSCVEIAEELEQSIDFLSAATRNVPERHKSLRATFEHSWRLLAPLEQALLRKLAVFRGGFKRDAARMVAGASIALLASLIDKSLLRVTAGGRYDFHPLVHDYAKEKLAEQPLEQLEVQRKHTRFFLRLLTSGRESIHGPKRREVLAAIEGDLANVQLAWRHAGGEQLWERLWQAHEVMVFFHGLTGRFKEGRDALAETVSALVAHEEDHPKLLGNVLANQGWFCSNLGLFGDAARLAAQSLQPLEAAKDTVGLLRAHSTLGTLATRTGRYNVAREHLTKSLALAREYGSSNETGRILGYLGSLELATGNYHAARRHYAEALSLNERVGNQAGIINTLDSLGRLNLIFGQPGEAREHLEQALALSETINFKQRVSYLLINLAHAHHALGNPAEARDAAAKALQFADDRGQRAQAAEALILLGHVAADESAAFSYLRQGLLRAHSIGDTPRLMLAFIRVAQRWLQTSRRTRALELLAFAAKHPATRHEDREQAEQLLAATEGWAARGSYTEKSKEKSLDLLVSDLLLEL